MNVTTESKRKLFRRLRELDDGAAFAKATSAIEERGDVGDVKAERETIIAFKSVYVNRIALIAAESGPMLDCDIGEGITTAPTLREDLLIKLDRISDDGDESLRYAKCRTQNLLLKEAKNHHKYTEDILRMAKEQGDPSYNAIVQNRAADREKSREHIEKYGDRAQLMAQRQDSIQ